MTRTLTEAANNHPPHWSRTTKISGSDAGVRLFAKALTDPIRFTGRLPAPRPPCFLTYVRVYVRTPPRNLPADDSDECGSIVSDGDENW